MAKVVVITGASSGIGLSHAVFLTQKGYTVFGTCRDKSKINLDILKKIYITDHTKWKFTDKTKTKVEASKLLIPKKIEQNLGELIKKITFFSMDVTSDESVNQATKEMEAEAKKINGNGIDVLVNNAGIGFYGSAEEISMEDWKLTFETNLFGMLRTVRAILPFMKARKRGQIINTSTLGGLIAIPYQSHYSASKAAVKIFTEGLFMELRQFNIKVSILIPSDINTNFNRNTMDISSKEDDEQLSSIDVKEMIENVPISKDSEYFGDAKKTWNVIIKNLITAPPPLVVSKTLNRIIKARKPRIHYKSGGLDQIFLLYLIRRIVTDDFTYWLLPIYYGIH
ncbi:MAG: SDR family oxidoreductase [Candidatus Heimdallarchaeota archaeon]